jgi:ATP-dependent Clp protease ATP-binding subunit ClpC
VSGAELTIETLLLVEEWPNGHRTATAVAQLDLVSFGSASHVLADFETYLPEYLAEAPAQVVARFALPETTALRRVAVELERADLSARLRRTLRLELPYLVIPHGRDRWARIPALGHTLFLLRREEDDDAVRAEIVRLVAALELDGPGWLRLFPARDEELRRIPIRLAHGGDQVAGGAAARRRAQLDEAQRADDRALLASVARLIRPDEHDGVALVGRARPLAELVRLLGGASPMSLILVGEASAGKSALVRAWAALPPGPRPPPPLYSTSAAQLVAGMSGFGEWQERLLKVMQAAERLGAILYFENLAELLGEHPERGGRDVLGAMRRWVVDGRVRLVGELTPEALDLGQRNQVAFFGAVARVEVKPLDAAAAREALRAHLPRWNRSDALPAVDPDLVDPVVDLLDRYEPYRAFPGKAVRFVDELRASRAAIPDRSGGRSTVTSAHAFDAFSAQTGIPGFLLRDDRALLRDQVIEEFRRRIVGQEDAVRRVVDTLCVVKAGLQPGGRPLATFLLVGPTGVGKTELARTLAHFLFASEDRMVRFDMSEYADPLAAERLISGTAREPGLLTGRVRAQPFSVLLLDEIEKAHPALFDLLLQVLGEGRLTDARGRTTFFHNSIILMTSNLGASHRRRPIGLAAGAQDADAAYLEAARETFRAEFLGRIDRIIPFAPLTADQVAEVARLAVERIQERRGLQQAGAALEVSAAALARLAASGHSEAFGVRALRRHLDDELVAPAARLLAGLGADAKGALLWIGTEEEGSCPGQSPGRRLVASTRGPLRFEIYRRPGTAGRRALRGVNTVAELRREADDLMELDQAGWTRDQLSFLRSQLAAVGVRAQEIEGLRSEHHRLQRILAAAETALADIHAAEELALTALFAGEEARSLSDEAEETMRRFRRAFFYVATAEQKVRDTCTIAIFDPDRGPLALWLGPMLEEAERRGWEIEVHVRGRLAQDEAAGWPADRVWSAPRGAAFARQEIVEGGAHDAILLRVRGRNAGLLVGMEDGVHRFLGYAADDKEKAQHLVFRLMTMRADLTDDDWKAQPMQAPPPERPRAGHAFTRSREAEEQIVIVHEKDRVVEVPDAEYWQRLEEIVLEDFRYHLATDSFEHIYQGAIEVWRAQEAARAAAAEEGD